MSIESDLISLQSLVAEQAQTIEDLSQELYNQQKEILLLKEDLKGLKKDLETSRDSQAGYHNEPVKPPHY